MNMELGQRVEVGEAKGDRERFRGRHGCIVRLQPRPLRSCPEPWPHVLLDGAKRSRVFFSHELTPESGTAVEER